jgi:hypothetical protein
VRDSKAGTGANFNPLLSNISPSKGRAAPLRLCAPSNGGLLDRSASRLTN